MNIRGIITISKDAWRKPIVRVIASFSILALLICSVPFEELLETVTQISLVLWIGILVAFLFGHLIAVAKWMMLINIGSKKLPLALAVRYYFAGLFANIFLPSIAGGDVVRAGLAIRYMANKEAVMLGGLVDRFFDVIALGLLIGVGSIYSHTSISLEFNTIIFNFAIFFILCVIVVIIVIVFSKRKNAPEFIKRTLRSFRNVIKQLLKNPQRALGAFLISLLVQSAFVLLNAGLGMACNINVPLSIWFLVWPLAKILAMAPISLGGIGVRETAFAVLFARFGVPFSSAVGVGILWESIIIAGGLFGGVFYFFSKRKYASSKRAVEESIR